MTPVASRALRPTSLLLTAVPLSCDLAAVVAILAEASCTRRSVELALTLSASATLEVCSMATAGDELGKGSERRSAALDASLVMLTLACAAEVRRFVPPSD